MENGLLTAILGGTIGFILSEIVQSIRNFGHWCRRPILKFLPPQPDEDGEGKYVILRHPEDEWIDTVYLGVVLCNSGKRISTGIRVQLLEVECLQSRQWRSVLSNTQELMPRSAEIMEQPTTLVSGAKLYYVLATNAKIPGSVLRPAVKALPEYFEESCGSAERFRYTIIAFDDERNVAKASIELFYTFGRGLRDPKKVKQL